MSSAPVCNTKVSPAITVSSATETVSSFGSCRVFCVVASLGQEGLFFASVLFSIIATCPDPDKYSFSETGFSFRQHTASIKVPLSIERQCYFAISAVSHSNVQESAHHFSCIHRLSAACYLLSFLHTQLQQLQYPSY